ncbi:type II secretion system F family protein [Aureimonas jatrophae]|uniref:Tight adherence protein B n=1 Tax=Aureimonas jatrophae TaxID=1166073 RepID=A0A1H0LTZ5_9HYPH|nr:type II secretion system F family protein [Aureimonas jatrophae]MBB3952750.1 tight adherence protein B [Aureimonas jatrophae]SDO71729.1 tight adherence protein B [Aureimonas jatrophae]
MIAILFVALVALSCGALAFAVLEPRLQAEKHQRNRFSQFAVTEGEAANRQLARDRLQEVAKRRRTIQASLDELDAKNRKRDKHVRKLSLERQIAQAGFHFSVRSFWLGSAGLGVVAFLVALVMGAGLLIGAGIALSAAFGLPRWILSMRRKRRQARFSDDFANAVDVIVRGIRSGLPLTDTLRIVANDTPEPVSTEFRNIIEAQQMGLGIAEAVERLYQNMPLPETNFFAIVITIQSQAGGNLAEALSNLSRVLRERKKMKAKIQAMSMEAKASGGIIGALPPIVGILVYLTAPEYISVLFSTTPGNFILAGSALWMSMGVFVMRQMINFDF